MKVYPEDSFIVYETSDSEVTLRSGGKAATTFRSKSEDVYRFDVRSVDDSGTIEFHVTFQKVKNTLIPRPLGKVLEGKSFSVRMSPDGRVTSFGETDALRAAVASDLTALIANDGKRMAKRRAGLLSRVEDDVLRGWLEFIFRLWPPTPVSAGDEWVRDDISLPQLGIVDSARLTLTSWKGGEAKVSISSTLRASDTDAHRRLSGYMTGMAVLDAVGGFPESLSYKRHLEGTVTQGGTGPVYMEINSEAFIELLRL